MMGKRFERLPVWIDARWLVKNIYQITRSTSLNKEYSLRNQIERAAVSIMANIAEGYERDGDNEFVQYLSNAKASAGELRSHLYVVTDAGFIEAEDLTPVLEKATSVSRQLSGMIRYIRKSKVGGRKFISDPD